MLIIKNGSLNRLFCFLYDLTCIPLAWYAAYWIRFNLDYIPHSELPLALFFLAPLLILQLISYLLFNVNRGIWRFTSMSDLLRIIKAVTVAACLLMLGAFFYNRLAGIPRSVPIIYSLLLIFLLGSGRFFIRLLKQHKASADKKVRVLIVGAGQAGEGLIRDLLRTSAHPYHPIAFVDDDKHKLGKEIHGIRVLGQCADIPKITSSYAIDLIFIALPSADSSSLRRIIAQCKKANQPIKTLPGLNDLVSGNISLNTLREVKLEDLLGRDPVKLNWQEIEMSIQNKKILVSGGGGSIGSELCRQIARLKPAELIVIEHNEFNLYSLQMELSAKYPTVFLQGYLADVSDKVAVNNIMQSHQPEIVFHAAAYKHVPLLENQIRSALRNNIIGTQVMAETAIAVGTETFVLISSDKAVNPTNIMGASKRAAEIICQNLWKQNTQATRFITVRFGNVLGSSGSVVPLFQKQIAEGGPITVTHPDITRFFMSLSEACQLILQACTMGEGGEIFVLDMGKPIKIQYLAKQMVHLAGKKLGKDIEIIYTQLRAGEKMQEELFYENENLVKTAHKKILKVHSRDVDPKLLSRVLLAIHHACEVFDSEHLKESLKILVPEFTAQTQGWAEEPLQKIKKEGIRLC